MLVPGPHLLPYLCSAYHLNKVSSSTDMETVPFMMSYKGPPEGGDSNHKRKNQPLSIRGFQYNLVPMFGNRTLKSDRPVFKEQKSL